MMNRNLKHCLINLAIALAGIACLIALNGCVPLSTMERRKGFNQQWSGFNRIAQTPSLHYETEIKVKVIVDGNLPAPGVAGTYSHPDGVIRIQGKMVNGKIVVPEVIIGHEFIHALQFQAPDGQFANPDED